MHVGTSQVKGGYTPVNRSTTLSPPANNSRSKGAAASGCSAARHLHSHSAVAAARKARTGYSEEVSKGDGGKSTTGCSGAPHTAAASAGEKDVGAGGNRRSSANSMRGDLRVKADQVKFDQIKFDSAKFGHQVASGSKAVFSWTANLTNSPRRTMPTGSAIESTRIQSMTAKSTTSSVVEPAKQIGQASVTSSTGHAPVITGKQPPELPASAAGTADRPTESSVVVVLTKNKMRGEGAVVSCSDSVVRPSVGYVRLLNPASEVHASPSYDERHLSTIPTSTPAGHGLQTREVSGKVCRKESESRKTQEAGSFRQISSSSSYTLVLDPVQGKRSDEHSRESRGAAIRQPQHCKASCKLETVKSEVESVRRESTIVASNLQSVGREVENTSNDREVITEPEDTTSEADQAIKVDLRGRKRGLKEDRAMLPEDKAIVCDSSSSSLAYRSPAEPTEFQKSRITNSVPSETASEVGASMKVRFTKPVCVNETLAVDHFRSRLAEERAMTSKLKRQLGALRKDLDKSRTDLLREEELRKRAEEWAEYLERELESYVRSRAEAEERYLNLLQVVRDIDRFTKQLLQKYVALHHKVETSFESFAPDCPPKIHHSLEAQCLAAAAAADRTEVQGDPAAMTAEAADSSTSENDQRDNLSNDDYDFISKYLKASASLQETHADVDSEGLFLDADKYDAEVNWSSNNYASFRDVSRSFDEIGGTEEQDESTLVPETKNVSADENNGDHVVCAGDDKKQNFDVRLRRLSQFFDQVIRICYKKPEAYFRVLEDRSCCLAEESRLPAEEKKRRGDLHSERQRSCQDEGFICQARSHGAGDIAREARVERENGNGCQEHLASGSEDEANWEHEEKQEKEEEKKKLEEEVEKTVEEEKREEKTKKSKRKSVSLGTSDQEGAVPSLVTSKAEEKKTTTPSDEKHGDRPPPEVETKDNGQETGAAGSAVGDGKAAPSDVQRRYVNRLLREMCYYCDRYRPGDRAAGLKAYLKEMIETEFLSKDIGD